MVLEAPTDIGRKDFATEVLRCLGDDELKKLAEIYKDHILRVCKSKLHNESQLFLTMKCLH